MSLDIELEQELTNRKTEMKTLHAIYNSDPVFLKNSETVIVKTLYVYLYAHFEGFCKNALQLYIEELSTFGLICGDVKEELVVSSFEQSFKHLDNAEIKHPTLGSKLPDDSKLHRHWRRSNFYKNIPIDMTQALRIDSQKLIDTESNLKPTVLRKLLFQSGLDVTLTKADDYTIKKLLEIRNAVAHSGNISVGQSHGDLEYKKYNSLEEKIFLLMDEVKQKLLTAIADKAYLK